MRPYNVANYEKLDAWLGEEIVQQIIDGSKGFYSWLPIANVPGSLWAYNGEIYGTIQGASFTSLSDLIAKATSGKRQDMIFIKAGSLAINGSFSSLWNVGSMPSAGGAATNIPSGTVPTNISAGSLGQRDPVDEDTLHLTTAYAQGSTAPNTLLLYDRLWHGASGTHTQTSAQVINGSPSRYTGTGSYGNFAFLEVTTALGATAQNMTMTYVDQDGNAPQASSALAMVASSAVTRIPHTPWFIPLASGDLGIRRVTQIQMSAANTAGLSNIVLGHAIGFIPCPTANIMTIVDGINSAFSLVQIQVGACLAFIELKGVASPTTYSGQIILVSG